ncbi:uncharacterized protein BDR25DRAFT_353471 [Lindgomyces ingoldianus]|uniref:Uncharacterized protein n=1 Tax=Lindgomyces ingoldianus TaxID=673940 RepID=A0ACB6R030_9PLEO|nr:uncharacterized protein BDR25DRAFT_353471 [Lindgomyces ingoldianus]KAF2472455.1 hypothetical protein BDR25DRAFT_353471 [Lindgomyces ingoldianus]
MPHPLTPTSTKFSKPLTSAKSTSSSNEKTFISGTHRRTRRGIKLGERGMGRADAFGFLDYGEVAMNARGAGGGWQTSLESRKRDVNVEDEFGTIYWSGWRVRIICLGWGATHVSDAMHARGASRHLTNNSQRLRNHVLSPVLILQLQLSLPFYA